jgi:signal recognition particle receptor subunit beta
MALINHRAHEIHFKIVYVGPGAGGKTTNLRTLHDRLPPERRGRLLSISTDHERTLFFDFLPIDLGQVNGFATRFHLYTVPGQVYYRLSRRAVLQGLDGVVFVADSHPSRETANLDALADTHEHLKAIGMTPGEVARLPWVFQWNKRDLPGALSAERLSAALNPEGSPAFEAIATAGNGVTETLRAACKAVLGRLAVPAGTGASAPVAVAAGAAAPTIAPPRLVTPTRLPIPAAAPRPAAPAPGASPVAPRPAWPAPPAAGAPRPASGAAPRRRRWPAAPRDPRP